MVSDAAVSVNLWVKFIRIAGSNARDNPYRLVVVYSGDRSFWIKRRGSVLLVNRFKSRPGIDSGADRVEVGSSDVSGSENRGGDQSDTVTKFSGRADVFSRRADQTNTTCWIRACYSMGLVEGCNPSPTISPPSSLVSDAAVSVNLWVKFIRIAGSNARDNPSRLVVVYSGDRSFWIKRRGSVLLVNRFKSRLGIDSASRAMIELMKSAVMGGFGRRGWISARSAEDGVVLNHVDLERYFSQPHGGRQLFERDSVD
ncbi:hypothetical protein F2Q69_00031140 [Brassica cretica]|uniref:Uncharacterized protein n=1 Tax=Brassica cretica TaxID=69181 RepID=A0A8S9S1G4_BRACR|nr:hypothetical protein F2Q69_00031140 [Brassica cretica]